jgi:hypothetical protein
MLVGLGRNLLPPSPESCVRIWPSYTGWATHIVVIEKQGKRGGYRALFEPIGTVYIALRECSPFHCTTGRKIHLYSPVWKYSTISVIRPCPSPIFPVIRHQEPDRRSRPCAGFYRQQRLTCVWSSLTN